MTHSSIHLWIVVAHGLFLTIFAGIPTHVAPNITTLELNRHYLGYISAGAFCHISHLRKIVITYAYMLRIPSRAFECLDGLQYLSVQYCQIKNISKGAFGPLRNLQTLDLKCKWGISIYYVIAHTHTRTHMCMHHWEDGTVIHKPMLLICQMNLLNLSKSSLSCQIYS